VAARGGSHHTQPHTRAPTCVRRRFRSTTRARVPGPTWWWARGLRGAGPEQAKTHQWPTCLPAPDPATVKWADRRRPPPACQIESPSCLSPFFFALVRLITSARTPRRSGYVTQAPRNAFTGSWGHSAATLHVTRTRCEVESRQPGALPYLISRRPPIALEHPNFRFSQTKFGLLLASARRGSEQASGAEQQPVAAGEANNGNNLMRLGVHASRSILALHLLPASAAASVAMLDPPPHHR
jgi:hypothetical protein